MKALVVPIPFDLDETQLVLEANVEDRPFEEEFQRLLIGLGEAPWLDKEEVYEVIFRATVVLYKHLNRTGGPGATWSQCFATAVVWYFG